eukprot:714678-Rhodomonas_salina.2
MQIARSCHTRRQLGEAEIVAALAVPPPTLSDGARYTASGSLRVLPTVQSSAPSPLWHEQPQCIAADSAHGARPIVVLSGRSRDCVGK